jgi:hypothetical protein
VGNDMFFATLTSARSLSATSARHGLATHPRPPSATGLRKPPAASLPSWIQATTRTDLWIGACNSPKNARPPITGTRLVQVTHPFHPLRDQQLPCVGERHNRYGMTLLLETSDGAVCSVRPQWTDVVAPDAEIVLGGQRALFRVADLLELVRLVDRLSGHDLSEGHR